jgi:hypothetical protein
MVNIESSAAAFPRIEYMTHYILTSVTKGGVWEGLIENL